MPELSYWINALKPCERRATATTSEIGYISAIHFVRNIYEPSGDSIYIGSEEEMKAGLLRFKSCRGITFFSSGGGQELIELALKREANLVTADMDIIDIYERLSAVMRRYQNWNLRLLEATNIRNDIHDIVNAAAELAEMPLILLNSSLRVIYCSDFRGVSDPIAEELFRDRVLSVGSAAKLLGDDRSERKPNPSPVLRRLENGNLCWIQKVYKDNKIISTMLLFAPPEREDFDSATILELTKKSISRIMQIPGGAGYWTEADFKTLLDDIVSQRLTDEREITSRLEQLSPAPSLYCTFIIVEFNSPGGIPHPFTHLFIQLEELFPDSNAAVYDDFVVLMISRPDRVFQPTPIFDNERFTELLVRYNAYASISNATSRRSMLRTNYLISKSILRLGKALRLSPKQRIFFFEDYAEYFMIDLCINSFCELLGHDDIIYLTHPEAIALARYDKENNTNLLDVLYYYCLNNCNVVRTAKAAYMHRNTVTKKIAQIQELIKSDLNNAQTQQRMIFSYKILRYFDKYAKINLKERLTVIPPSEYEFSGITGRLRAGAQILD